MTDVLDHVPDEDREWIVQSDAVQVFAAVLGSEWLAEDPAGDEEYDREVS